MSNVARQPPWHGTEAKSDEDRSPSSSLSTSRVAEDVNSTLADRKPTVETMKTSQTAVASSATPTQREGIYELASSKIKRMKDKSGPSSNMTKRKRRKSSEIKKKPRDMPKRPLSSYNIFFREERARVLKERGTELRNQQEQKEARAKPDPELFATMGKTIASRWKDLAPEDRVPFENEAKQEMKRYRKEMEEYKQKNKSIQAVSNKQLIDPRDSNVRSSNQSHSFSASADAFRISTAVSVGGRAAKVPSAVDPVSSQDSVQMPLLPSERPAPSVSVHVINKHHQFSDITGADDQGQAQLFHFNLSCMPKYHTLQQQQNLQAQNFSQVSSVQQAPNMSGSFLMAQMQQPHAPSQPPCSEILMQRFVPTQVASFSPTAASFGSQPEQMHSPGPNYSPSQFNSAALTQTFTHAWMPNSMYMQQPEGIEGLAGTTLFSQPCYQCLDLNALPSQELDKIEDSMHVKKS